MKRSATQVAILVAGLIFNAAPATAQDKGTTQAGILGQIAGGRDASAAIRQYQHQFGPGNSERLDRSAALRQVHEAETALANALQALQAQGENSGNALAAAAGAYRVWLAAGLLHDAHQAGIETRLAASDDGRAYVGKHVQVAAAQRARRKQISDLLDPVLGTGVTAKPAAAPVKAALALLKPVREHAAREPILHALELPVGGAGLAARKPVLTPLLVPSYATQTETAALTADSAGTPEAPLSEEIATQSAKLGGDYVRIYEFVRNEHRTEWYAGSVRGALGTLRNGAGNDIDQASLLVALLRASGVPSRYVRGVVELDVEKVANDLGLTDPAQVPLALTKAGVAFSPVARGGRVAAVQVEHVWVSALVPYTNYRGAAVDASGKTWIPLDPSFKDTTRTAATVALGDIGSSAALQADYLSQVRSESFAAYLQHRVTEKLEQRDGVAADYTKVLGNQAVAAVNLSLLPNSLPYPVLAVTYENAALAPTDLVHAKLTLSQGTTTVLSLDAPLHELGNQRVTLGYQPATLEDHRLTLAMGGIDGVPLYLISLRPQLNVGGKPRALGGNPVAPGSDLLLEVVLEGPFGSQRVSHKLVAGGYQAIHLGGAGATRPATAPPSDSEGIGASLLDGVATSYNRAWAAGESELAALSGVALVRPVPAVSIVTNQMETEFFDDVPQTMVWKGVTLDAATHPVDAVGANAPAFLALSGLHGSTLESVTFATQFSVGAISAERGLAMAKAQGIAIWTLSAGNIGLLDSSDHLGPVKDHIRNLVRLGYKVDVPAQRLSQDAWSGSVWRAVEESSGASGYFLSGGLAGGATTTAPNNWTLDFLAAALASPNADPFNPDPLSGAHLVKLGAGDGQTGVVGAPLPQALSVLVQDKNGLPVRGAPVHFSYAQGAGNLGGAGLVYHTATDERGIATVSAELGISTEPNARFIVMDGSGSVAAPDSELYPTRVSLNVIDVSADSRGDTLHVDAPFTAVAKPDAVAGVDNLSDTEFDQRIAFGIWGTDQVAFVHDKYKNPIPNVSVTFDITSELVCKSDNAQAFFRQGTVFDATLDKDGKPRGCKNTLATIENCGAPSVTVKTQTNGVVEAGVIGGNDPAGKNVVKVRAAGFEFTNPYHTWGQCMVNGDRSDVVFGVGFQTDRGPMTNGVIDAAATAGKMSPVVMRTTTVLVNYPHYEVRVSGGQKYLYFQPFPVYEPLDVDRSDTVSNGGQTLDFTKVSTGVLTNRLLTGPTPGLNVVTTRISATFPIPEIVNNEFRMGTASTTDDAVFPAAWGVKASIDKIVGGTQTGDFPDQIVLGNDGKSERQVEVQYKVLPAEYKAVSAELDLLANGARTNVVTGGSRSSGEGSAFLPRGQKFDSNTNYEVQLVLNRGLKTNIESDPTFLPTHQRVIAAMTGAKLKAEVDVQNKRVCDTSRSASFSFFTDAVASLSLQAVDENGAPQGAPRVLFADRPFPAGTHSYPMTAGEFGDGKFRLILSAFSASNPLQKDVMQSSVESIYKITDQLPIGNVIVHGVKVRDGSLMAQTQSIDVAGRGPDMRFQPTYSSTGNGDLSTMGRNWSHNFNSSVKINGCGDVVVSGGDGGGVRFFPGDNETLVPAAGYHSTLKRNASDRSFDFYSKDGTQHHYKFYDDKVQWLLDYIKDTNGNRLSLSYDVNAADQPLLARVSSDDGRAFQFKYEFKPLVGSGPNVQPLLAAVTGPGIGLVFTHDDTGNLTSASREGRTETFNYDKGATTLVGRALMVESIDPNKRVTTYHYNGAELRVAPDGQPVVVVPHNFITSIDTPSGPVVFGVDVPNFQLSTVTDQNQHTTTYELDKRGSPLKITDAAGTTKMTWLPNDILMDTKTDARGVQTDFAYDAAGNKIRETTSGIKQEWNYLIQTEAPFIKDRLRSHTDRNGQQYAYELDLRGNVRVETLPENVIIKHEYKTNGDRISTRDGNGGLTTFTYDGQGNPYSVTDPVAATVTTVRNARGFVIETTDAMGNKSKDERDALDQVRVHTDPLDNKRHYTYDDVGNKLTEIDEEGAQTTWTYLKHNLPETITRAGATKTITYDGVGNKKTETDFRHNETSYVYDGANRLKQRIEPLNKITEYGYDEIGNVTSETDALKHTTTHVYNDLSQRILTTDAAKGEWVMEYDNSGNKTLSRDPLLRETRYVFDGLNRPKEIHAPLNANTYYEYDKNNNKVKETDPNGHVTRFVFDEGNRLTEQVHANGKSTINTYDKNDSLLKTIDPNLNATLFSYDALNRKKDMKDGEGYITTYGYYPAGNLKSEELPNGNKVVHTYNELDLRTNTTDNLGLVGSWDYDDDGNKTLEVDANGNRAVHHYNELSQLTRSELPEDRVFVYEPDLMGNRLSVTDPMAGITRYKYDELNRVVEITDARKKIHTIKYDSVGNKTHEIDPYLRDTVTEYDALNRPKKITDALLQEMTFEYDFVGNKKVETNKRAIKSTFEYDALDHVSEVRKAGLLLTKNTYDDAGNLQSVTDANGYTTSYLYDKRNLRKQEARPLGATSNYTLDEMGDVKVVTDPEGRETVNTYDARRRLITQRNAAIEETGFGYDGVGNRTRVTRPLKGETTMVYDGANRIKTITDPVGTTEYRYDKNGNHKVLFDAMRNETGFDYDELNRRTAVNYPGGVSETFTYDDNSNLLVHTDGNGVLITHTYDELNREKLKTYSRSDDGLVSIATAYDANNNVKTVTQTGATAQVSSYEYDDFDREELSIDPFKASARKIYDSNGNKKALITQDGKATTYVYDALNRLESMNSQSGSISYRYDKSSLNTKTIYSNGVTSTNTYDRAMRVETVAHTRGTTNLSLTEYKYDSNGNRKKETINRTGGGQVTTYDYDEADRLKNTVITEPGKTITTAYEYDKVANRKVETVTTVDNGVTKVVNKGYDYDGRNQLRKIVDSVAGTTILDYDGEGNLVQKTLGNDLTKYEYNANDALTSVTRNSTVLGRYFNDYRGLRVEKEAKDPLHPDAAPVRMRTLWDGRNAFQDSAVGGAVLTRYENDGRHPVSMWSQEDGIQALHRDALGSIVATTDTSGQLRSEYVFDAFGNLRVSTGASANKFGYTGHQMDKETGLVYFQARYYDPELGRFITQDPYEGDWNTPLSLHHYLYAYANPTTYIDLNGYFSLKDEVLHGLHVANDATGTLQMGVGAVIGAEVGAAVGIAKLPVTATVFAYDTGKFMGDAAMAVSGNEHGQARMHERGKSVALALFGLKDSFDAYVDNVTATSARRAADGNYIGAGFALSYDTGEVVGPALVGGVRGSGPAGARVPARVVAPAVTAGKPVIPPGDLIVEGKVGKEIGLQEGPNKNKSAAPERTACRCCFVAGTPILTQDGFKAIEDIREGDLVASKEEVSGTTAFKPVTALIETNDKAVYILTLRTVDGGVEQLTVTDNHPFWVLGKQAESQTKVDTGWVESAKLTPGMQVQTKDGTALTVVSVIPQYRIEHAYNFSVAEFHTYFVGKTKVWVHNSCACGDVNINAKDGGENFNGENAKTSLGKKPTFFTTETTWTAPGRGTGIRYKVYQQEIDWDLVVKGVSNAERAKAGGAPYIMKDGVPQQLQLHHSRQNGNGPLFEASRSTHLETKAGQGREAVHPYGQKQHPDFPVDRSLFKKDVSQYWRDRLKGAK